MFFLFSYDFILFYYADRQGLQSCFFCFLSNGFQGNLRIVYEVTVGLVECIEHRNKIDIEDPYASKFYANVLVNRGCPCKIKHDTNGFGGRKKAVLIEAGLNRDRVIR